MPGLGWLRDLADAAKHRGLGRNVQVEKIEEQLGRGGARGLNICGGFGMGFAFGSGQPQRAITLKVDGTVHWLADVSRWSRCFLEIQLLSRFSKKGYNSSETDSQKKGSVSPYRPVTNVL